MRVFKSAQVNRCYAQIRGDHVLRNPVMDVWEDFSNAIVPLLSRSGIEIFDPLIMDQMMFELIFSRVLDSPVQQSIFLFGQIKFFNDSAAVFFYGLFRDEK